MHVTRFQLFLVFIVYQKSCWIICFPSNYFDHDDEQSTLLFLFLILLSHPLFIPCFPFYLLLSTCSRLSSLFSYYLTSLSPYIPHPHSFLFSRIFLFPPYLSLPSQFSPIPLLFPLTLPFSFSLPFSSSIRYSLLKLGTYPGEHRGSLRVLNFLKLLKNNEN